MLRTPMGIAVILDVVYNHLGPDGNYIAAGTARFISRKKHKTPMGMRLNFDDEQSGLGALLFHLECHLLAGGVSHRWLPARRRARDAG